MTRDAIATDKLAAPVGPFSVAMRGAGLLFLSGQVAQDQATGKLIDGDVARQTHQILGNIATALETVGKSLGDVLRVGVYLTDISDFKVMNQAYSEHADQADRRPRLHPWSLLGLSVRERQR